MMEPWTPAAMSSQQQSVVATPQAAAGATQCCECLGPLMSVAPDAPPAPVQATPPVAVITHVEWLDGAGDAVLGGEGTQFVNLPVADKWVGGQLASNARRLGRSPGFKVTFDQPGAHAFRVKLAPGGSNAAYTGTETPRNAQFVTDTAWMSGTTEADGTQVVATGPSLCVAGNDTYMLEAHDDNATTVSSGTIRTLRAVHLVQVKMDGLASIAPSIAGAIGEYAGHFIRLVELPAVTMPRIANVGRDTAALNSAVVTAWDASQGPGKAPYAIRVVFTDHLAVRNPSQSVLKTAVAVGPTRPAVTVAMMGPGMVDPSIGVHPLWKDLVPGESWFVSASYTPDGGGAAVPIPEGKCSALPAGTGRADNVSVDVTGLPAGTGTITLTVNWVDRMRGGIALAGPTVVVCTRGYWVDIPAASQNCVVVHELGHKFGMVPEGSGRSLDRHADQYTNSGHIGSHCHTGTAAAANYGGSVALAASTCVMFGTVNGRLAYCGACAPQVRKVDLGSGW
jgi:hypothetical protein